ncbi:unnamed protein product [Caenorhabditis sp. 36 PRJEB53466]|nr:unnamed protein product [Caenorhabditis sp. 36 PRJEB53466]
MNSPRDDFVSAGYCTHWPDGHFGGGSSFRFAPYPVTLFRAELASIEEALKQAVDANIQKVTVITSSVHFINAWRRRWMRAGDEKLPYANKIFYERICDLCARLQQVHFRYEEQKEKTEIGKELEKKCTEGLSYGLVGKDTSEYDMRIADMTGEKEYRQEGVPIVRLFKTGTDLNAGFAWEGEEAVSCCGTPKVLIRILEDAVARDHSMIIIRADSEKLIKSYEAFVEVWRRNGWRNSQHKRIGKSAEWEKTWRLKQKVHVCWELMETPDEQDRIENRRIPEWKTS